jgi:hypothetical protein
MLLGCTATNKVMMSGEDYGEGCWCRISVMNPVLLVDDAEAIDPTSLLIVSPACAATFTSNLINYSLLERSFSQNLGVISSLGYLSRGEWKEPIWMGGSGLDQETRAMVPRGSRMAERISPQIVVRNLGWRPQRLLGGCSTQRGGLTWRRGPHFVTFLWTHWGPRQSSECTSACTRCIVYG